jgi:hypothetical protein
MKKSFVLLAVSIVIVLALVAVYMMPSVSWAGRYDKRVRIRQYNWWLPDGNGDFFTVFVGSPDNGAVDPVEAQQVDFTINKVNKNALLRITASGVTPSDTGNDVIYHVTQDLEGTQPYQVGVDITVKKEIKNYNTYDWYMLITSGGELTLEAWFDGYYSEQGLVTPAPDGDWYPADPPPWYDLFEGQSSHKKK